MTGKIEETGSSSASSGTRNEPIEHVRRKPGANGTPVTLADGRLWMLANPTYQARPEGLTQPRVDQSLDQIFECSILNKKMPVSVILEAARQLLKANYDLSEAEVSELLSVSPGAETRTFTDVVLSALFGADRSEKTYTSWVRASLIANGLAHTEIPAQDVANVVAILAATNRTIPLSAFADACLTADTKARLESLI
jgi:hypothetical protein